MTGHDLTVIIGDGLQGVIGDAQGQQQVVQGDGQPEAAQQGIGGLREEIVVFQEQQHAQVQQDAQQQDPLCLFLRPLLAELLFLPGEGGALLLQTAPARVVDRIDRPPRAVGQGGGGQQDQQQPAAVHPVEDQTGQQQDAPLKAPGNQIVDQDHRGDKQEEG